MRQNPCRGSIIPETGFPASSERIVVHCAARARRHMLGASHTLRMSMPETSDQFSYTCAPTARATIAPVMSEPPREKVLIEPSGLLP